MTEIYPARSWWAGIITTFLYSVAIVAIFLTNIPLLLQICLIIWLALDYRRVIALYALGTHNFALVCIRADCGKWLYQLRNGRCYKAQLQKRGSFCSSMVLVLRLSHLTGTRTLIIPRDSLSVHNYRFLAFNISNL